MIQYSFPYFLITMILLATYLVVRWVIVVIAICQETENE